MAMGNVNKKTENTSASVRSQGLLGLYAMILLLASVPSKFIFYLIGPVSLLVTFVLKGYWRWKHLVVYVFFGVLALTSIMLEPYPSLFSLLLWPVTYGTFVVLFAFLVFPIRVFPSESTMQRAAQIATYWIGVQGIVGVVQYLLSGNTDAVAGTVGLLDLRGNITINQVYFGFAVLSLVPAVWFAPYRLRYRWASLAVSLIAVAFSQSGHGTVAFVMAFTFVYLASDVRPRALAMAGVVIVLLGSATLVVYPNIVTVSKIWLKRSMNPDSPKALMVKELWSGYATDAKLLFLGSGPGQYVSRAALIGSGLLTHFKTELQKVPRRTEESFLPVLQHYYQIGEGSAIAKPYNSFVSLYAENGVFVATLVVIALVGVMLTNLYRANTFDEEQRYLRRYVAFYVLFLLLVSLVELYFEMPAAIAPGGWLAIMAVARSRYLLRAARGA